MYVYVPNSMENYVHIAVLILNTICSLPVSIMIACLHVVVYLSICVYYTYWVARVVITVSGLVARHCFPTMKQS